MDKMFVRKTLTSVSEYKKLWRNRNSKELFQIQIKVGLYRMCKSILIEKVQTLEKRRFVPLLCDELIDYNKGHFLWIYSRTTTETPLRIGSLAFLVI